jgi:hypothetical protein
VWFLVVAFDCGRPSLAPWRVPLGGAESVTIGRGPERAWGRDGATVAVVLDDRFASQAHAQLLSTGAGWQLLDCGSKNGTLLGGQRVDAVPLAGGEMFEIGDTFLVLRRREDEPERGPLIAALASGRTFQRAAGRALHRVPAAELGPILAEAIACAADMEIGLDDLAESLRAPEPEEVPSDLPAAPTARLLALLDRWSGNVGRVARALETSRTRVRQVAAGHGVDVTPPRR